MSATTAAPGAWKNRIVESGTENPDQLLANPKNWRIHPQHQQEGVTAILETIGWVQDVVVNRRTGFLVDGHLRVALAMRHNQQSIPVKYVDLSDDEEALVLATLDPLAGLASTDRDSLEAILAAANGCSTDPGIGKLLDTISQDAGLVVAPPPTMEELSNKYGEHDPAEFWPVVKVKIPPESHERFLSLMGSMPGSDDASKFSALLERVDAKA